MRREPGSLSVLLSPQRVRKKSVNVHCQPSPTATNPHVKTPEAQGYSALEAQIMGDMILRQMALAVWGSGIRVPSTPSRKASVADEQSDAGVSAGGDELSSSVASGAASRSATSRTLATSSRHGVGTTTSSRRTEMRPRRTSDRRAKGSTLSHKGCLAPQGEGLLLARPVGWRGLAVLATGAGDWADLLLVEPLVHTQSAHEFEHDGRWDLDSRDDPAGGHLRVSFRAGDLLGRKNNREIEGELVRRVPDTDDVAVDAPGQIVRKLESERLLRGLRHVQRQ